MKYTDSEDILKDSYSISPSLDDVATRIFYAYNRQYSKDVFLKNETQEDRVKSVIYGRDFPIELELEWTRNKTTADDVISRMLNRRKELQVNVSFDTSIQALDHDLLDEIEVEHFAGPAITDVTITGIDVDLDNFIVSITATALPIPLPTGGGSGSGG